MTGTWDVLLPVIQQINDYGGNFISGFVNRSVIEEVDQLAAGGDTACTAALTRICRHARNGRWPFDPPAFGAIFTTYHEVLFYLLAKRRGVALARIPETSTPTADYRTTAVPVLQFELKTLDFSGGEWAYKKIAEDTLEQTVVAADQAKTRGTGIGRVVICPHGPATNAMEAIARVMAQISSNIKNGQFAPEPTILVVPLIRTAIRCSAAELEPVRHDVHLGGDVSGHLWTIAAHPSNASFLDASEGNPAADLGPLARAGILRDHPVVRGIVFLGTRWSELPSADDVDPTVLDRAYDLIGVWSSSTSRSCGATPIHPAFALICDDHRIFTNCARGRPST